MNVLRADGYVCTDMEDMEDIYCSPTYRYASLRSFLVNAIQNGSFAVGGDGARARRKAHGVNVQT